MYFHTMMWMFQLENNFKHMYFLDTLQIYNMFHVTWTTFKFNGNQLLTVSAFVIISVPSSNVAIKSLTKNYSLRISL